MLLGCTTPKLKDLSLWIRGKGTPATQLQPTTTKENFGWVYGVGWQGKLPKPGLIESLSPQELGLFHYSSGGYSIDYE
jgi:hypothetical protein